jgi:hypothetical protein
MNKYYFTVANVSFCVISNISFDDILNTPFPYSLHANYDLVLDKVSSNIKCTIEVIHNNSKDISVTESPYKLQLNGDFSAMYKAGYNPQFNLFGNRGIINKYILHSLEKYGGNSILHACAVLDKEYNLCIGIGGSGSGKSVFVGAALSNGWKLIATEHVIIGGDNLVAYSGNKFDNSSVLGAEKMSSSSLDIIIHWDRTISDPTDKKILVDYSSYSGIENRITLKKYRVTLVSLCFGNDNFKLAKNIDDNDYIYRLLQINSSEKITFPLIFGNVIAECPLNGSPKIRTEICSRLINSADSIVLQGGDKNDFDNFFNLLL